MTREKIPGIPSLEEMVHALLDLYEKDSIQVGTMLEIDSERWLADGSEYVSLEKQIEMMSKSSDDARTEIERKTLINTRTRYERYRKFQEALGQPEKYPNWMGRFRPDSFTQRCADREGMPIVEFLAKEVTEELHKEKLDVELLRFFLDRLDPLVTAIEQLDDTDFRSLVPESLVAPFRELHINAVLGNYGTAIILCGALLEHSLQDLLPTEKMLDVAIKEAKEVGLLKNHSRRHADAIRDRRNDVVHGSVRFDALKSEDVGLGI